MKKILIILSILITLSQFTPSVFASNSEVAKALDYLKSKQDNSGKITGFGGESQWAAIAFTANDLNISDIKNPDTSLKTYLLNDQPAAGASATEWERRILAIVAIGENPGDFGGINYVQNLKTFIKDNQLGETTLLNDDIFGLLALIASGPLVDQTTKQNVLDFIITHQTADGGFSYSTDTTCAWCSPDSNDTASALQALQAAKQNGLTNANLDSAIDKAKAYLFTTQKANGGFGYDTYSDSDGSSTAWAIMALNSLGLNNSSQAQLATSWLINNQETDGGFHWMAGAGSDTSTTSHAAIALSGKSWILRINSSETSTSTTSAPSTPTPTSTPLSTPSPTPTSTPTHTSNPTSYSSITPTPFLPTAAPKKISYILNPEVLGTTSATDSSKKTKPAISKKEDPKKETTTNIKNKSTKKDIILTLISILIITLLIIGLKIWENKKNKK